MKKLLELLIKISGTGFNMDIEELKLYLPKYLSSKSESDCALYEHTLQEYKDCFKLIK